MLAFLLRNSQRDPVACLNILSCIRKLVNYKEARIEANTCKLPKYLATTLTNNLPTPEMPVQPVNLGCVQLAYTSLIILTSTRLYSLSLSSFTLFSPSSRTLPYHFFQASASAHPGRTKPT